MARKSVIVRGKLEKVKAINAIGNLRLRIKIVDGPIQMVDKHVFVELTINDANKLAAALQTDLFLSGPVEFT